MIIDMIGQELSLGDIVYCSNSKCIGDIVKLVEHIDKHGKAHRYVTIEACDGYARRAFFPENIVKLKEE